MVLVPDRVTCIQLYRISLACRNGQAYSNFALTLGKWLCCIKVPDTNHWLLDAPFLAGSRCGVKGESGILFCLCQ